MENSKRTPLESPPLCHLLTKGLDYPDKDEQAYARDAIDSIFFLDPIDNKEEATPAQLRADVRGFET